MILVHCWEEEEPEDMHLKDVVDILLSTYSGLSNEEDVRLNSQEVSAALRATVAAKVARHAGNLQPAGSQQDPEEDVNMQEAHAQQHSGVLTTRGSLHDDLRHDSGNHVQNPEELILTA